MLRPSLLGNWRNNSGCSNNDGDGGDSRRVDARPGGTLGRREFNWTARSLLLLYKLYDGVLDGIWNACNNYVTEGLEFNESSIRYLSLHKMMQLNPRCAHSSSMLSLPLVQHRKQ